MLRIVTTIHIHALALADEVARRLAPVLAPALGLDRSGRQADRGQSTAEYALVLLGAAAIALLLVAWAGKTDRITKLLNGVIDRVIGLGP